jgi:arylsulfatase A-like enzyme
VTQRAASPKPFFFYLSFTAPHYGKPKESDDPKRTTRDDGTHDHWPSAARPKDVWGHWNKVVTQAPGKSWVDPDFDTKPPYLRKLVALNASEWRAELNITRQRAEALTVVDDQVGSLMRTLADTGEAGNTLVVFTSDNGYFLGEQHMRWGKIYPHEPSLRVPLLMRGPGIPAGSTREDPFTSVDYVPTLADVAGTTPQLQPDGISLWDVAQHGDKGWTRAVLTETDTRGNAPRDTDLAGNPLSPGEAPDPRYLLGLRTPQYLYVDIADGSGELYDLDKDPQEYKNLIDDPAYADTLALLRDHLAKIRACRGADCATPMPIQLQRPTPAG